MNLKFLETFVWVAQLRSFSLTAERMGTTQAAVSNRIATLERDLGVRLLERDARSIALTPQGERALSRAEEIVRLADAFRQSIGDTAALSGSVTIGVVDSIVYAWLPRLIERVQECFPRIAIELNVDTSLNLTRQICDRQIGVGLMMGPVIAPGVRNIDLCTFDCLWIASPRLALPAEGVTLADVVAHPIFAYSRGSLPHQALLQLIERAGWRRDAVRVYNSNSLSTVTRLIRDGLGLAILPHVVVREFLANGELRVLDVVEHLPPLQFHAVVADRPGDVLPGLIAEKAAEVAAEFGSTDDC
ncbi:HTH-type transcriptional regulator GltR [Methylobacterium crusticola]|uniref:HTH-type transcriptional regulator GltR n=1 Tax=Methylobacterium crusticola TaxID=1697972 RepID=A0ABQ4R251_9HYPH|nr:LysR family transcriptional regulator [Methylobacterium crusticola]GJD51743.1 HTH-type transcriptional regulator GltR [Methylobacterium crusticola]